MNNVYDELLKNAKPTKPIEQPKTIEGYIWVNMLIKYNLDGKAEIIRSFSKPAKESTIKSILKPKKFGEKITIKEVSEKTSLY